jgi:AraC family transcriptional regulator, regulatory protein of adaptative response / methylated-DNA-[protein]-cysteine methyltransferase
MVLWSLCSHSCEQSDHKKALNKNKIMIKNIDYHRVAEAIEFLSENFKSQPDLNDVAKQVHLSPQHFQRIFTEWAGVSPKKFMQFLTLEHLRERIFTTQNLNQAAEMVGFSTQSRVYDLFVSIEGVTPNEYKTLGQGLEIQYGFHQTPFGECFIAMTEKGLCALSFVDETNRELIFQQFMDKWQSAKLVLNAQNTEGPLQQIFEHQKTDKIHVWVQGTNFQLKVWEALLKIPQGSVTTYQHIAESIENPKAVRAVGTAIGNNPIAYLILCHRVIKSTGMIGEYHWGSTRKKAILGYEMAKF